MYGTLEVKKIDRKKAFISFVSVLIAVLSISISALYYFGVELPFIGSRISDEDRESKSRFVEVPADVDPRYEIRYFEFKLGTVINVNIGSKIITIEFGEDKVNFKSDSCNFYIREYYSENGFKETKIEVDEIGLDSRVLVSQGVSEDKGKANITVITGEYGAVLGIEDLAGYQTTDGMNYEVEKSLDPNFDPEEYGGS